MATSFFACFAEDPSLSGPTFEELEEARRVGELPFDAVLESVTFVNTENGQSITVDSPAPPMRFSNCNARWCPVADPLSPNQNYYCPGPDDQGSTINNNQGLQFSYDSPADRVSFLGYEGSPPFELWAERDLSFGISVVGRDVTLSCTDCPGKYEDFLYTERYVNLRSQD